MTTFAVVSNHETGNTNQLGNRVGRRGGALANVQCIVHMLITTFALFVSEVVIKGT
jgi:hypothetical protein